MSTATLTSLLEYLYGTLAPSNMRWVAAHLMEQADKEERQVKPYTMEEIDEILDVAEENFSKGIYVTNEEVMRHNAKILAE